MKKLVFFVLSSAMLLLQAENVIGAMQNPSLKGRIVDESEQGIGYATVVLLSAADSTQVTGMASDAEGKFALSAPKGSYLVRFSCLGYGEVLKELALGGDTDMGPVVLQSVATDAGAVTVTARAITREADRFVVTVANNPVAIGKDAFEMLKVSPGVWASTDGISINGRSGTRVMIDDRLVRMSGDQLEAYLRSIDAQDIAKIEIILDSGAEYDADSSGGTIKITLRKRRNDGVDGTVGVRANAGYYGNYMVSPNASINYKTGKFNFYTNLSYNHDKTLTIADEETIYDATSALPGIITTTADMNGKSNGYNGMFGAFYDIDARQNIGLEVGIYGNNGSNITDGTGIYQYDPAIPVDAQHYIDNTKTESRYGMGNDGIYYSGTLNYIYKLDDKGSVFKLIGDYVKSTGDGNNTFDSRQTHYFGAAALGMHADTLYQSASDTDYRVMALTANFDFAVSRKMMIKAGAKYSNNNMYSKLVYEGQNAATNIWTLDPDASSITEYTENIAALYAIYSGTIGKFNISAGLRGEYTFVNPRYRGFAADGSEIDRGNVKQEYPDIFPNLNVSYPLNDNYSNTLVLSYGRTISRPDFRYLSPFRNPLSDYSQVAGNPDLKAMYANNFSLSGVFAYKYNITIGAALIQNHIQQKVVAEDDMLVYKFVNIPRTWQFYAAVNAPVTFTKWWSGNFNLAVGDLQQQLEPDTKMQRRLFGSIYGSMNFALPADFNIELSGYAMTRIMNANMVVEPTYNVYVEVKKRFYNNRFTASIGMHNILDTRQSVYSYGPGFTKWAHMTNNGNLTAIFSLRYNFQSGVQFRSRQIEKGSAEDAKRMGGGQ